MNRTKAEVVRAVNAVEVNAVNTVLGAFIETVWAIGVGLVAAAPRLSIEDHHEKAIRTCP